jgi:hypothetical protein
MRRFMVYAALLYKVKALLLDPVCCILRKSSPKIQLKAFYLTFFAMQTAFGTHFATLDINFNVFGIKTSQNSHF